MDTKQTRAPQRYWLGVVIASLVLLLLVADGAQASPEGFGFAGRAMGATDAQAGKAAKQTAFGLRLRSGSPSDKGKATHPATETVVPDAPVSFVLDDGTIDGAIGFVGSNATEFAAIWLNRFTPSPAVYPIDLNAIQIFWPGPTHNPPDQLMGQPIKLLVYNDADGDGNPGNAALIATISATIGITNAFQNYPVNVTINGPTGDLYIGFEDSFAESPGHSPENYPASLDQTASQGKSWVAAMTSGANPNLSDLSANDFIGTIDSFGLPGNWMIRADGDNRIETPTPTSTISCTPGSYTVTTGASAIVPGTTDIGNHCDDCNTSIALPFTIGLYGQSYTTANVGSNGYLSFGIFGNSFYSGCLPHASFTFTIFPFETDQDTRLPGKGIFTELTGTAPNRTFYIEWRNCRYNSGTCIPDSDSNYEIVFQEGQFNSFEVRYGTFGSSNATVGAIGVQRSSIYYTQLQCNIGPPVATQTIYSYTPGNCPTNTPTPAPVPTGIGRCNCDLNGATTSCTVPNTYDYSFQFYTYCGSTLTGSYTVYFEGATSSSGPWVEIDQQYHQYAGFPPGTSYQTGTFTETNTVGYDWYRVRLNGSVGGGPTGQIYIAGQTAATVNCAPTPTTTPTLTGTPPTNTSTSTPTFTITLTRTRTATGTRTHTRTPTGTRTYTPTPTETPTFTPSIASTVTPTSTPTSTQTNTPTYTPAPDVIIGHLTWQGISQPNIRNLDLTGTLTLCSGSIPYSYTISTDADGSFLMGTGLPDGIYGWWFKGPKWLATSGTLTLSGTTNQDLGIQKAGDANNSNVITSQDFVILKNTFGKLLGDTGYDPKADFDNNGVCGSTDFNLQRGNFGQSGATPNCP